MQLLVERKKYSGVHVHGTTRFKNNINYIKKYLQITKRIYNKIKK